MHLNCRLSSAFGHLREHKFQHNFADTVNLLCLCALETASTENLSLRCQNYVSFRTDLMNELSRFNRKIIFLRSTALLEVILCGHKILNDKSNHQILTATIIYVKNAHGLNVPCLEYLKVILPINYKSFS